MKVFLTEDAERDLSKMDNGTRQLFLKHFRKIALMPPRRHLRFGVPHHVENVSKQARIIYDVENEVIYVLRCFDNHKDYKKWYKQY